MKTCVEGGRHRAPHIQTAALEMATSIMFTPAERLGSHCLCGCWETRISVDVVAGGEFLSILGTTTTTIAATKTTTKTAYLIGGATLEKVGLIIVTLGS